MIYVHLATGFEEIEALTAVDLLRRADIQVQSVSIEDKKEVTGAHNITVAADILFEEADYDNCEMIVLPGGMPGTLNLQNHPGLSEKIDQFYGAGKYIAAICAAPMILGAKGYLDGRDATIYTGMEEHLGKAVWEGAKAVKSDHIITGKGPGCAIDFALMLIEVLKGKEASDAVKADILF